MSAAILLVTHNRIGDELLAAATSILGRCPLPAKALAIRPNDERDQMLGIARLLADRLDEGDGLLVMTDLYGSTPANIACALGQEHRIRVLSGVNLPMLMRALNYAALGLEDLADKALSGARDGVMICSDSKL